MIAPVIITYIYFNWKIYIVAFVSIRQPAINY
jgi:hypothetical protein